MNLVDTHCHIQSAGRDDGEPITRELWAKAPQLTADVLIKNADAAGVTRRLCVGCDLLDSKLAIDFVKNRENCWATIGIHPHEAKDYADDSAKWQELSSLVTAPKVVAIGECGLDYFYRHSPPGSQLKVLKLQMELAIEYQLPMVFHVREAFDDFWTVFDGFGGAIRGVLHSFTDSRANLDKALERGLCIGINGIATFTKHHSQLDMYRVIPLKNLLLETDAPFLTPTPYRGTINEPKHVLKVAEFLSQLRHESLETLAEATTINARTLFGVD